MPEAAERSKKASPKAGRVVKLDKAEKPKKNVKPKKVKMTDKEEKPRPLQEIDPEELVFALDIGTRTVVGVVGVQEGRRFRIITTEVIEHKNRAMLDGQIHDIDQVASVVKEVKDKIEVRLGIPLKRAAIAAAGRVLRTARVRVDRELDSNREIDRELVNSIEIEGIQKAQMNLDEDPSGNEGVQFYCVGYSVINYYLNNYIIARLEGHKGKNASADILATFLPHVVVDSLYTVLNRVGLEVSSLTLEPIAAINVVIPSDLRLLNLALVDIGAGTSDIALTKDGSVVAYAMAPIAGDEITEKLSQHYLVDFNTADKIKISLSAKKEEITFFDILKIKKTIRQEEALEVIKPTVEELSEIIAKKIVEYNGKAPNAVFLIGGGSQIPGLTDLIADKLKLPAERVAVRSRDVIQNIRFNDKRLSGPESITPYGIAVTAQMQKGKDFMIVTVNGRKLKLFNSRKLSVADTFILLGYNPGQLFGRSGKSLSYTLNGEKLFIRGEHGKTAEITVNDKPASLDTAIKVGDDIRIIPAQDGKDAVLKLSDIADIRECLILVNGIRQETDYAVADGDRIEIKAREVQKQQTVQEPDEPVKPAEPVKPVEAPKPYDPNSIRLMVNGNEIEMKNGKSQHIFVDIFNYINFDLSRPQGNIVLKLNGRQAAFTDTVKSGDTVEIYWEK
jgi:cell division protein FtsA